MPNSETLAHLDLISSPNPESRSKNISTLQQTKYVPLKHGREAKFEVYMFAFACLHSDDDS